MGDTLINEYSQGVNHYYGGVVPDNWDNERMRANSPYLTGWYQASLLDLGLIQDEDEPCIFCGEDLDDCECD